METTFVPNAKHKHLIADEMLKAEGVARINQKTALTYLLKSANKVCILYALDESPDLCAEIIMEQPDIDFKHNKTDLNNFAEHIRYEERRRILNYLYASFNFDSDCGTDSSSSVISALRQFIKGEFK